MNDFFYVSNSKLSVEINETQIFVRQFQMKEINQFVSVANPIRLELSSGIDHVIKQYLIYSLSLVSMLSDLNIELAAKLLESDYVKYKELLEKIIEANSAFFNEKIKEPQEETDETWFDILQHLVKAGHRPEDVMNMTYGAFIGFCKAINKQCINDVINTANITRTAHHADNNSFKKFTSEMKSKTNSR